MYCSRVYRFGFNTQEKDDEVYGAGNLNTAEFWEYDTRLGRRWNIDPKPRVGISDYSVMDGNPIANTDVLGDNPGIAAAVAEAVLISRAFVYSAYIAHEAGQSLSKIDWGLVVDDTKERVQKTNGKIKAKLETLFKPNAPVVNQTPQNTSSQKSKILESKGKDPRDGLKTPEGIKDAKEKLKEKLKEQDGRKFPEDKKEQKEIETAEKWAGQKGKNKERTKTKK